jgi:hypothetical protein
MLENYSIDTFYAIDFDRCLGDVDKGFELLERVLVEIDLDAANSLKDLRFKVESSGGSFSPYRFLKQLDGTDWSSIRSRYLELSESMPTAEDGAHYFIDYLKDSQKAFCIMSYGDLEWQMLKIEASGFADLPVLIVDSLEKSKIVKSWQHNNGQFAIPEDFFSDSKPRTAREVVLIDDKAAAFHDLPDEARGYWVNNSRSKKSTSESFELPERVVSIDGVHGIAAFEMNLV